MSATRKFGPPRNTIQKWVNDALKEESDEDGELASVRTVARKRAINKAWNSFGGLVDKLERRVSRAIADNEDIDLTVLVKITRAMSRTLDNLGEVEHKLSIREEASQIRRKADEELEEWEKQS